MLRTAYGPPASTLTVERPKADGPRYLYLPATHRIVRLPDGIYRVGASPRCELVIDDPTVSRVHCEFSCEKGSVAVRDLDSKNGVLLRGNRIVRAELQVGDSIRLGRAAVVLLDHEPPAPTSDTELLPGVVGTSRSMKILAERVRLLASSELSVLVLGETGTGKELVARALHVLSARSNGPFQAINCGAIPRELIEAEIFGHVKGAFTGAEHARPGIFELAAGGTLFLDEVAELPLPQQPKLLRVLEDRTVRRIGGVEDLPVDVRVVTATHVALSQLVSTGRFRSDLFYRLGEAQVELPPLRRRRGDIPLLIERFLSEFAGDPPRPDHVTLRRLCSDRYPGNVRELRNLVRRAAVLGWEEAARPSAVEAQRAVRSGSPPVTRAAEARASYPLSFEELQRQALLDALDRAGGNKTRAARLLGMPKTTYLERLHRMLRE